MMHNPPHPGEILKEDYLNELNISVTEAAKALDVSRKALFELLNGHSGISPVMAKKLAKALNTSAEFWMNLQQQYDIWNTNADLSNVKLLAAPIDGWENSDGSATFVGYFGL